MQISIIAGSDKNSSSVNVSGTLRHIITDEERVTFGLGDHALKGMVDHYFGKRPDDAFLHSPTPWDDLYKRYSWPQVSVVVTPVSSRILSISSEPTIVKNTTFENNSNVVGTFNVGISESVRNTVSTNWSTGGKLTIGQSFKYEVGFLGTGGGGETSMSFESSWGKGGNESTNVTVGSSSGVTVELQPGQKVSSKLNASRGTMKVEIRYRARLTGNTAINYGGKHKGHHFWSLNINSVMGSNNKTHDFVETIEIGYYSDSFVSLDSVPSVLRSLPLKISVDEEAA
eukprot:IDg22229t1